MIKRDRIKRELDKHTAAKSGANSKPKGMVFKINQDQTQTGVLKDQVGISKADKGQASMQEIVNQAYIDKVGEDRQALTMNMLLMDRETLLKTCE